MIKNKLTLFGTLLFGIFLISFVSAVYSESNPNYGLFKRYDSGSSGYYTGGSESVCQAGQDFVLQIAPFGCEPAVVQSELLEEENVPVFCAIAATQVNPLIDVDAIESISFSGQYPKEISGVGFHPARAALGTNKKINYPILENIGYAVIVLKKQEVEAEMPDFVEGNLSAKIRYDIKDAFGVGNSLFYLPELNDEQFEESKKSYSFWNGRFYLHAERVEENYAVVSIHDGVNKISSVTLEKGKTSNKISLPGFNCLARLQLRLDGLENPGTIVTLNINGEKVNLVKGQKFIDNNCQIVEIDNQGIVQKVKISCYEEKGRRSFDLTISPRIKINFDGEENDYSVGERVGEYTIAGIENRDKDSEDISTIEVILNDDEGNKKFLFSNSNVGDIKLIGFAEPLNSDLSEDSKEYYDKAFEDYDTLINSFGENEYESEISYKKYALQEKIKLAKDLGQKRSMSELCSEYEEKFGGYDGCQGVIEISSSGAISEQVFINNQIVDISLVEIVNSDFKDYGARVIVEGKSYDLEKDKVVKINSGEFLQLVELEENYAKINVNLKKEDNVFVKGVKKFELDVADSFGTDHKIVVDEINLKKFAKVSVVPSIDSVGTSSDFGFKIGIEKRAIQLAPDEIQKKIDSLNETISKWQEREESLGKMVKTMKGACMATSTFLIAKNFLFNQGESLARSEVTSVWNQKCTEHMSGVKQISGKEGKNYATNDACLADNSEAIDEAVSSRAETMEEVSETFSNLQEGITEDNWAGLERVVDDEELWNKVKSSNLLSDLENDLGDCYGEKIKINEKTNLETSDVKERISKETMTITQLRDLVANAKDCANNPEIAKVNLGENLGTLYANSEKPKQIEDTANKFGLTSNDVNFVVDKDAKEYAYKGKTYVDVSNKIGELDGVKNEDPIAIIRTTGGKDYVAILEKTGDKYTINKLYDSQGSEVEEKINAYFVEYDEGTYKNKFISSRGNTQPVVSYYEGAPYKGLPAVVPFDLNNGWYVYVSQDVGFGASSASYDGSGAVRNYYLCNVGTNGREEAKGGGDKCRMINRGTGQPYSVFHGLGEDEAGKLVRCAEEAVKQASRQHGENSVRISTNCGGTINLPTGSPAVAIPDMQCQNFMSPSDCQLMFNVCDPVICPSSRCNFGGDYPVADVIQSGIVGGIFLCAPNFVGFGGDVYIPLCLSGIHAGIEGLLSIYTSYRDCLQENLNTGKTIGICDEIHSIYLCEFLWKQALPLAKYSIPKIIESLLGQNTRGGGEYFAFSNAISVADKSIDYFTDYYAANSFQAFKVRSTEEVGTEICRNYASGVGPNVDSMLESFTNPDSPAQFHGWFEEEEYTTATVPPTSQYKVFYHIYSGKDSSAYYQVYLKGGEGSSYYQDSGSTRLVDSGYVNAGEYVSETKDFLTTSGYRELCIRVNDQEECGFKKVSTSFAVDYITDEYVSSIATEKDINSEGECVSGNVLNTLTESEIYEYGVIRICAHDNPGVGTDAKAGTEEGRWTDVGWCDESKGIKCWLDRESVEEVINSKSIKDRTLKEMSSGSIDDLKNLESVKNAENAIDNLKEDSDENKIISVVNKNYGSLIMNDYKIKALKLRAMAYGILAKSGKSESVKTGDNEKSLEDEREVSVEPPVI